MIHRCRSVGVLQPELPERRSEYRCDPAAAPRCGCDTSISDPGCSGSALALRIRSCTPVVPFCFPGAFRFKSLRNKIYDFEPTTIGEHVKKKRLQLGLTQGQVAKRLSVCSASVTNWENGDNQPADAPTLQRIIRLLGYDPVPIRTTIPDLLRAKRRELGMGQREFAAYLGVDPSTIMLWEQGGTILPHRYRHRIASLLGLPELELRELMRRRLNASQGRNTPNHDRDVIKGIRAREKAVSKHRK